MMWMVHSVTYKAEHPTSSRNNSSDTSKLWCISNTLAPELHACSDMHKTGTLKGDEWGGYLTADKFILYLVFWASHCIVHIYIYKFFCAKGLRNTNTVFMVNHIRIMNANTLDTCCTYIHTYIHAFQGSISVAWKTVGCRKSHKYTNTVYSTFTMQNTATIYKIVLWIINAHKKFTYRAKLVFI